MLPPEYSRTSLDEPQPLNALVDDLASKAKAGGLAAMELLSKTLAADIRQAKLKARRDAKALADKALAEHRSSEQGIAEAIRIHARFGAKARQLAYASVSGRFPEAQALLGPLNWSADGTTLSSTAGSSDPARPGYAVALHVHRGPKARAAAKSRSMQLYYETDEFSVMARCACPFFAKDSGDSLCKHIGALANQAAASAESEIQRRALSSSIADAPARLRGKRL